MYPNHGRLETCLVESLNGGMVPGWLKPIFHFIPWCHPNLSRGSVVVVEIRLSRGTFGIRGPAWVRPWSQPKSKIKSYAHVPSAMVPLAMV